MPNFRCGSGWTTKDGRCPARFCGNDGDEQCVLLGEFPHPAEEMPCMISADEWALIIAIADAYRAAQEQAK